MGTGAAGQSADTLQTLPYDRYIPQTRPADWDRTAQSAGAPVHRTSHRSPRSRCRRTLRVVAGPGHDRATARRDLAMSQGLINGRKMDLHRVDVTATLGATEIWEIENLVGMDHPFHLHGFQFQVLDRDGVPEPYRRWKDTVNVPKHETVRLIVQFDDYSGALDVPLPHPRPRRRRHDGDSRSQLNEETTMRMPGSSS